MAKVKFKPTQAQQSLIADKGSGNTRFQLMVEFEAEGDSWCMVSIEDNPMPGYTDDASDKPQRGKFVEAYGNAMKGQPTEPMGGNGAT